MSYERANEGSVGVLQTAAALHDVLEDTEVTHDELVQHFGWEVAHVVSTLTKRGYETYNGYIQRISESGVATVAVKVCDLLCNMEAAMRRWSRRMRRACGSGTRRRCSYWRS